MINWSSNSAVVAVVVVCLFLFSLSSLSCEEEEGTMAGTLVVQNYDQFELDDFLLNHRIDFLGYVKEIPRDDDLPPFSLGSLLSPPSPSVLLSSLSGGNQQLEPQHNQNSNCIRNGKFCLNEQIFHGGHGDVFRARLVDHQQNQQQQQQQQEVSYVLKRMTVFNRPDIQRCAEREIYFGKLLNNMMMTGALTKNFPRFVTHAVTPTEFWLVFRDEGISLQQLFSAMTVDSASVILRPSILWRRFRTTDLGQQSTATLLHMIITHVASLHAQGIVHRDIKLSNILLNTNNDNNDTEKKPYVVINDYSSAVNKEALELHLFGEVGPSVAELTLEYAPPEVILQCNSDESKKGSDSFLVTKPEAYDVWSIGVVFLELLLGTSKPFYVTDSRNVALIQHRLHRLQQQRRQQQKQEQQHQEQNGDEDDESMVEKALYLAALAEFGIFNQHARDSDYCANVLRSPMMTALKPIHETKSIDSNELMRRAILRRDPLGKGLGGDSENQRWAVDLLLRLLAFQPHDRIDLVSAQSHAFFVGSYVSNYDGSEHATEEDLRVHDLMWSEANAVAAKESPSLLLSSSSPSSSSFSAESSLDYISLWLDLVKEDEWEGSDVLNVVAMEASASDYSLQTDDVVITFHCPKCHRKFATFESCQNHIQSRKHGFQCFSTIAATTTAAATTSSTKEASQLLPSCNNNHDLELITSNSGFCDIQGRRNYIEDYYSFHHHYRQVRDNNNSEEMKEEYLFYGLFDGHLGSRAARFASRHFFQVFHYFLQQQPPKTIKGKSTKLDFNLNQTVLHLVGDENDESDGDDNDENDNNNKGIRRVEDVVVALDNTYAYLDEQLDGNSPLGFLDGSGATATTVLVFENHVAISNVGDSRVILCCDATTGEPKQLTVDHTLEVEAERNSILSRGGFVVDDGEEEDNNADVAVVPVSNLIAQERSSKKQNGIARVNGVLAVTRSLGDIKLKPPLSNQPDTTVFAHNNRQHQQSIRLSELVNIVGRKRNDGKACLSLGEIVNASSLFMVLASDGLWDVMSNKMVTELVCEILLQTFAVFLDQQHQQQQQRDEKDGEEPVLLSSLLPIDIFHSIATNLTQEAWLRGSTDNIGTCVISLF